MIYLQRHLHVALILAWAVCGRFDHLTRVFDVYIRHTSLGDGDNLCSCSLLARTSELARTTYTADQLGSVAQEEAC